MKTWVQIDSQSDFSIHNIPFGTGMIDGHPVVCSRIGDQVINLHAMAMAGFFNGIADDNSVFEKDALNEFIGLGKSITNAVRTRIQSELTNERSPLRQLTNVFIPYQQATMLLPVKIGDYTDFYSSIEHATNVGKMFRDPANALLPNWKHIPIGYHGRASSIVISGTPFHRPKGQTKAPDAELPTFGPTKRLDFELEVGFIIGRDTALGENITTANAEEYIFGLALFNDWSARDVQQWEYVPLGPFLAKNFVSGISPWIVTLEALDPFRVKGPEQQPEVLPYLQYNGLKNYDIHLEVIIAPETSPSATVSQSNFKYMYWNMCQQLAHHTSNGCNVRIGDLMASGTISGPDQDSLGSMLEISMGGKQPFMMPDGKTRSFIEDGDTVILKGWAEKNNIRVGFGEVTNKVLPAH